MAVITKITELWDVTLYRLVGTYVRELRMDWWPSCAEWKGTYTEYEGSRLLQNIGNNLPQSRCHIPEEYDIQRWHNYSHKVTRVHDHHGLGSSVGIVPELRAGRSAIESRWRRDFPPVQTGPGAHPASCKMGTGSFPGVKCAGECCWPLTPF